MRTNVTRVWAVSLVAALVAVNGLLATTVAYGAPTQGDPPAPKPGACLGPEVASLTGPKQLDPGGTGTIVAKLLNPNPTGTCDDGMQAEITFNGTADAIASIDGGPDVVCAEGDSGPFAFAERCLAATFPGGATVTLTFRIKGVEKQDRIAIGVTGLNDNGKAVPVRPGKLSYTDLIVTVSAAGNAPAPKPGQPSSSESSTGQMVQRGANGQNVEAIQHLLNHHGAGLDVDGDFGPVTEQAVRDFQGTRPGVTVDGVVGPQTWSALWVTLRQGGPDTDDSDAVRALQTLLTLRGHPTEIDGYFGPETEAAVKAFQRAKSLPQDGVVSTRTWTALVAG